MPLIEDDFVKKAVELCNIPASFTNAEVERSLLNDEHRSLPFIDDPEQVAVANSVIDSLNTCRHFAHPRVLDLVSENIKANTKDKNPKLAEYVIGLLQGQLVIENN